MFFIKTAQSSSGTSFISFLKTIKPKVKLAAVRIIIAPHNFKSGNLYANNIFLWALIKYDYYIANGLRSSPPTIEELLIAAQQGMFIQAEVQQMFNHIPVPEGPITEIILDRW